CARYLDVW
nr:immunoglobulin heavy chain junction region [Mus musculus]